MFTYYKRYGNKKDYNRELTQRVDIVPFRATIGLIRISSSSGTYNRSGCRIGCIAGGGASQPIGMSILSGEHRSMELLDVQLIFISAHPSSPIGEISDWMFPECIIVETPTFDVQLRIRPFIKLTHLINNSFSLIVYSRSAMMLAAISNILLRNDSL